MFEGHKFVKLVNNTWVLDITEYTGYKVELGENNEVLNYIKAFKVTVSNNEINFDKYIKVPLKILKEASNQIKAYEDLRNV